MSYMAFAWITSTHGLQITPNKKQKKSIVSIK